MIVYNNKKAADFFLLDYGKNVGCIVTIGLPKTVLVKIGRTVDGNEP
jgi:hypothetical protein